MKRSDSIERCPLEHGRTRCYVVRGTSGRILGHHPSLTAARRQVRAINIAKARKAGHRIPKRSKKGRK